jgi:hypothetical protein
VLPRLLLLLLPFCYPTINKISKIALRYILHDFLLSMKIEFGTHYPIQRI